MSSKVGGHVSASGGVFNTIKRANEIEAECVQFFGGSPRTWSRKLYNEKEIEQYNLIKNKVSGPKFIHALYLVNLTATKSEIIDKSMEALSIDLQNSTLLGCQGVVIHIGSLLGQKWDDIESDLISRLEKLISISGSSQVILENSASLKDKIGTIIQFGKIFSKLNSNNLKICLDTAHLFASGYDLSKKDGTNQVINELNENKLIDQISCIHLNESKSDFKSGRDLHANLGQGKIGNDGLIYFLNQTEFSNLPIVLEVPGDEDNTNGPNLEQINIAKSWITK